MSRKRPVRELTVTVDSISEGIAVLEAPGGTVRLPAALLPEGAAEGTRLTLSLRVDPDATRDARDEIRRLRRGMTGDREPPDVTEL